MYVDLFTLPGVMLAVAFLWYKRHKESSRKIDFDALTTPFDGSKQRLSLRDTFPTPRHDGDRFAQPTPMHPGSDGVYMASNPVMRLDFEISDEELIDELVDELVEDLVSEFNVRGPAAAQSANGLRTLPDIEYAETAVKIDSGDAILSDIDVRLVQSIDGPLATTVPTQAMHSQEALALDALLLAMNGSDSGDDELVVQQFDSESNGEQTMTTEAGGIPNEQVQEGMPTASHVMSEGSNTSKSQLMEDLPVLPTTSQVLQSAQESAAPGAETQEEANEVPS